jgi:tetratricopeptide (TPR) repeat protein
MDRLASLRELLKETPGDLFLHYAIALELAAQGNRAEAISRIENIIAENPDYLGAYYQLGQYYEQENNFESAAKIYTAGISVAEKQGNKKTLSELRTALELLD